MFYCRNDELNKMNKRYNAGGFECVVIYGRRRIGKTSLINEFCKDKKTIYFSALDTTSKENLRTLSKAIYVCENEYVSNAPEFQSFDAAFDRISKMAEKERLIFVIDEYPYLAKAEQAVSSMLQHLIDHVWSNSKLYLILCGSSMCFMEYQVLGYESPLYGRRTAQFKIEALTYKETAVFNPTLSVYDNALIYGVTGGVPHYINKLDVADDVNEALKENVFERSAYLFEEPENLLKQELREPGVYNSIITAIAEGASRLNELATKTGLETAVCSKYISVLMDLGIVKRETPLTEKNSKKTIYMLADNFFRFWYRFVPQNITAINSGRINNVYDNAVKKYFSDYMGLVFEKMCQEYLLYYAELPINIVGMGQWWGTDNIKKKQVQIDIIGELLEEGEYIIGSCKYRNELIGVDEYELLREYAGVFGKGRKYHYYIFSKSGFTDELKALAAKGEVRLVTLEEMYS
ncbi:MAG: ATP-binding protein [Lachnospiraceae bacterium]|nr:ATP-binding protein [Lachnospiraceae bacterium]